MTPASRASRSRAAPSRNWRSGKRSPAKRCEGASCLKYWPPGCGRSSRTTMRCACAASGRRRAAAIAAARPAGPAPTTRTSTSCISGASPAGGTSGAIAPTAGGADSMRMPAVTLARHARWLALPSIVTRQSKHAPMPHHRPRGAPEWSLRRATMPAAERAAATLSPARAVRPRPSKLISTVGAAGSKAGLTRRMAGAGGAPGKRLSCGSGEIGEAGAACIVRPFLPAEPCAWRRRYVEPTPS